jgi:hypothetical protein
MIHRPLYDIASELDDAEIWYNAISMEDHLINFFAVPERIKSLESVRSAQARAVH